MVVLFKQPQVWDWKRAARLNTYQNIYKIYRISALIFSVLRKYDTAFSTKCHNFCMLCLMVTKLGSSDSLKEGDSNDV